MALNFDEIYKPSIACLRFTGSHPDIDLNLRWTLRFMILHGNVTISAFFMFYSAMFHDWKHDLPLACSNLCLFIVYMYNSLSYLVMVCTKKAFKNLIATVKKDFETARLLPKEELKVVEHYAIRGRFVSNSWVAIVILFFTVFIIKPLLFMVYYAAVGRFQYIQVLELTFPAGMEDKKFIPLVFWVIFVNFTFADIYCSQMYTATIPMGPIFMLHACGQLELLKMRMKKIFLKDGTHLSVEARKRNLNDIAKRLQEIYEFVEHIKVGFKMMYEITLKGTALILPVVAFQVVDAFRHGNYTLEHTFGLFCGGVALCAYPCYYGDQLTEKGEELRQAVYMSNWETYWDKSNRLTLLIIMTRTQRSVAIKSMFSEICLHALTDVFRQAYALFSVLNAVWS